MDSVVTVLDLPATRFPNWYPDPTGRSAQRYFDGGRWTEHVYTGGRQGVDPIVSTPGETAPTAEPPTASPPTAARSARVVPLDDDPGAGHLGTARVLLVGVARRDGDDQLVHDQRGRRIGTVRVVRPVTARLARLLVAGEPASSCRVEVRDGDDRKVVELLKPARPMKVRMPALDGAGNRLGVVVQQQVLRRVRYSLEADDVVVGHLDADRWADGRIDVTDPSGGELARITRTWEVLAGSRFTPADTYVVELAPGLVDPVRGLVLAAALSVDTALRPG